MPDISGPANAFAIVGLADVVVRLVVQVSDIYNRCNNASKDVPRLLGDLKTLAGIVTQVRAFADEYNRSPFLLDDSQTLLPQLEITLKDCELELRALQQVANNAKSGGTDGWFKQWSKDLSWALNDDKVQRSCQKIEAYKVTLNTALSLIGR